MRIATSRHVEALAPAVALFCVSDGCITERSLIPVHAACMRHACASGAAARGLCGVHRTHATVAITNACANHHQLV